MSDLIKRLRDVNGVAIDIEMQAADEIESLQARIEQLEPFERLAKMSGQNIGLRLMDAEARIEVLEGERARRIKEMGELESMLDLDPTYHDMKRGFDKAQARIEQLKQTSEYWKAEHLAGNQRIAELESGISEVLQTWPPSGERVTLQLLLNPNMMAPQPPEER